MGVGQKPDRPEPAAALNMFTLLEDEQCCWMCKIDRGFRLKLPVKDVEWANSIEAVVCGLEWNVLVLPYYLYTLSYQ